jgi:hypothetical protein
MAIKALKSRPLTPTKLEQIGAIDGHLNNVRLAIDDMLNGATDTPDTVSTNRVFMARTWREPLRSQLSKLLLN